MLDNPTMLWELKFGVFILIIHLSVDIMITNFSPFSSESGEQLNKAFAEGHVFILILFGHKTNESVLLSVLSTLPSPNSF